MAIVDIAYEKWQKDFEAECPDLFKQGVWTGPATALKRDLMRAAYTQGKKAGRQSLADTEQLERALGETIDQRDRYHDIADDLASYIARITRVEIGEHSTDNCPWENAMRAAGQYKSPDLGEIRQFRALIEFALWQALTLPETDPRRDFIRQGNQFMALVHGGKVEASHERD